MDTAMNKMRGPSTTAAASLAAVVLGASLVVTGSSAPASAAVLNLGAEDAVAGEYIVDLRDSVPAGQTAAKASSLASTYGGSVGFVFESVVGGFELHASEAQATAMAADPAVESVEQDVSATLEDTQQPAPWHLDRIDQRSWDSAAGTGDGRFVYPVSDVPIYIVDSGVNTAHADFGGRAAKWFNAIPQEADKDCSGHGTLVAGVAAGMTYGVSKRSPIRAARVFRCDGFNKLAWIIEAVDEIAKMPAPAVINLSLSTHTSTPGRTKLDKAVRQVIEKGFTVVAAAGNQSAPGNEVDACDRSPGHLSRQMAGILTVGNATKLSRRKETSNKGPCVTLYAPGTEITGPSSTDNTGTQMKSGTSFAAPAVAGAAALMLGKHPSMTPAQVRAAIMADATTPSPLPDWENPETSKMLYVAPPDPPALPSSSNLNELFNKYGDLGSHWTGGDETMSVKLPDGRVAWFFGDTMLGKINSDRTRPPGQPMINNSVVIQEGDTLTKTLHGGTAAFPQSYVGAETKTEPNELGWWPGEGRINGNTLEVFYTHVKRGADGGVLSYVTAGRAIARFSLPSMALQELVPLNLDKGYKVNWGAAMVDGTDGKTYIYGTNRVGEIDSLYVARTPQGSLTDTSKWQYMTAAQSTGAQWSSTETAAVPIMTGIGAGFSVKPVQGQYALVTMDTSEVFSNEVVAYFAKDPAGPFTHQTALYSAPEPAALKGSWVYNARLHPEFGSEANGETTMVVSYNVGSFAPGACDADVHLCRPRFVTLQLQPPVAGHLLPNAPQNVVSTPANVTANKPGDTKVTLTWDPNPSTATGLKYWVYQRNSSDKTSQFTRAHKAVTGRSVVIDVARTGTYEFRVSAENAAGEGPQSLPARSKVTLEKPTAPANLVATAGNELTANLKWDAVSAAGTVRYNVYWRDVTAGQTAFKLNGAALVDGTIATVSDLVADNVYEFQVTATNGDEGPPSNTVRLTAKAGAPPAPTGLTAAQNPDGTIGLSWKPSSPDAWYWVWSKDVTNDADLTTGFTQSMYPVSNGTSFTAGYLTPGNKYAFYVTAIGRYGTDSPPSNIAQQVARIAPPATPGNLTATPNDDGTIRLSWNTSGPDIWYWVYSRNVSKNETTFTPSKYPVSDGTIFTAAYLTNTETYEFYVTAIGLGGTESAQSNKVKAKSEIAPPPAPAKLTASSNNDGTIALSWQSSGPDIWYWVWSKESTASTYTRSTYPVSSGTSFTAGYLTIGKSYDFYVTAIGTGDTVSAPSNVARAKSYVPPPAAPKNLKVTVGDGEAKLSWSSVGDGVWYYVYGRNVAKEESFSRSPYPISTSTTFTAGYLTNGSTYEFYVVAIDQFGTESAPSETVQAQPNMPPPPAPANLTAKAQNDGTIDLTWTGQGAGVGYWVYSKDITDDSNLSSGFTRSKYPVMSGSSFTAAYLTNKHKYAFYITAFNDGGVSARSAIVSATSLIPPPPAPTVSAKSNKDGTITLNWNNVGSGLWYWVYIRDSGTLEWERVKYPISNGTTFTAGYLSIGKAYAFKVTAIGPGGESAFSNTVTAVSRVPAPTNLTGEYNGDSSVMLDWKSEDPDAWFYVYVRDTRTSKWTRQNLPVSGRTWQIVSPLELGVTYEFFVKQIATGGETGPSNTVSVLVRRASGSTCAEVTSNWVRDYLDSGWTPIQRYDMTGTACSYRNGGTFKFDISWDSHGNRLNDANISYTVIDCVTGQTIRAETMSYTTSPGITQDRRSYTFTVDPAHSYQVMVAGGGTLTVRHNGEKNSWFGYAGGPVHWYYGITRFMKYSTCV
ncbi:fibronectin type III domain-containing protein [Actinoplanes xinjiangensis]|uniref:fibronectin type III domain-containing protein n=1 Tax=Actinoplanes xinjiangensis TaxID=512350 RepID=UPI0034248A59